MSSANMHRWRCTGCRRECTVQALTGNSVKVLFGGRSASGEWLELGSNRLLPLSELEP